MSNPSQKKIIVLGGTGETGRRVIFHLCRTYPNLTIGCASRSPRQSEIFPSANVIPVRLDIHNKIQTIATLSRYDLAIITLGPMDKLGSLAHQRCLDAGIDCVDINDSLQAADHIFALHKQAEAQHNTVMTGMGFTPGLSSLLLAKLADSNASATGTYRIRAYMGAAYGGGETSPYAMLSSFTNQISSIKNGQRISMQTPWTDDDCQFLFPGQPTAQTLIPYSSVECAGLATNYTPLSDKIKNLDCRYHIQYLDQRFARFLANIPLGNKTRDYLAQMFYRSGQNIKTKGKADPDTCLWVYPDNSPEKGLLIHGVTSSYDLTALMACAVTDCWLSGHLAQYKGVYATENLHSDSRQELENALARRGITYRRADLTTLQAEGIYFGWVEPVSGTVQCLNNFGANWYTLEKPHPKMIPLQKQFLLDSAIWKALRQQQSTVQFTSFVFRTLRRWYQHNQLFASYRSRSTSTLTAIWKRATQDISMFTSGYSCARDVLGQETAYQLYREMFLETGRMEMRSLWPEPETFAAFSSPADAVQTYWIEFMTQYAAIEVIRFDVEAEADNRTVCKITECAYAKMFIERGCPELANLVREMEQEAIIHLTRNTGLAVTWASQENGAATVTLIKESKPPRYFHQQEQQTESISRLAIAEA